ncbi:MAG: NAD-dependent epimerase/dehydratase family protein [Anaerolineae bacterium]|nr:NAD-dependent epimerase/dehydratase family protein [Anaerolineae bacterium]
MVNLNVVLAGTAWQDMTFRRALVTGANGFIGAALTAELLRRGIAVRAMCRTPRKGAALAEQGAEVVSGDVQDRARLTELARGCDVFFHVAAAMNGTAAYTYNVNVLGAQNAVLAASEAGCARFVHVSTIAVYGFQVRGTVREDQPLQPSRDDYYALSKALGERLVQREAARTGIPLTIIRPAYVYGEGSQLWSRRLYELAQQMPIWLVDGGRGNAHPIYIGDLCDLLICAAEHPKAAGEIFNAAPDPAPTWAEFLGHYARMAGKSGSLTVPTSLLKAVAPLVTAFTRLRGVPFDLAGYLDMLAHNATYSMAKARELLDWQARTSLEEGMRRTEPWLRRRHYSG